MVPHILQMCPSERFAAMLSVYVCPPECQHMSLESGLHTRNAYAIAFDRGLSYWAAGVRQTHVTSFSVQEGKISKYPFPHTLYETTEPRVSTVHILHAMRAHG